MCKYCDKIQPELIEDLNGVDAVISENRLNINWGSSNVDILIHYCPMCGKKL